MALPPEIWRHVLTFVPSADQNCMLGCFENCSAAVNRAFQTFNGSRVRRCRRLRFRNVRVRVMCLAHDDPVMVAAFRRLDRAVWGALRELRRELVHATTPTAFVHVAEEDFIILGGKRWSRHLKLPRHVCFAGTCCNNHGLGLQYVNVFASSSDGSSSDS